MKTPKQIKQELDKYVIGQDDAKKKISVAAYNHLKRIAGFKNKKNNLLFAGPTGCGKTYMVSTLSKIINVNFLTVDATSFTAAGYQGRSVEEIVIDLMVLCDNDGEEASKSIVFIDEIDKIAPNSERRGGDVSREGVQRDLLPLIEGTVVSTKYGTVETNHILFIASGAFHQSKPSDLLPELQGRLPVRVRLNALKKDDFVRILKDTDNSLTKQYKSLFETENIELEFDDEAIDEIANLTEQINKEVENIGARRLQTMFEKILEKLSFEANLSEKRTEVVSKQWVADAIQSEIKPTDEKKFIL